jgi:hypothetical protein
MGAWRFIVDAPVSLTVAKMYPGGVVLRSGLGRTNLQFALRLAACRDTAGDGPGRQTSTRAEGLDHPSLRRGYSPADYAIFHRRRRSLCRRFDRGTD